MESEFEGIGGATAPGELRQSVRRDETAIAIGELTEGGPNESERGGAAVGAAARSDNGARS